MWPFSTIPMFNRTSFIQSTANWPTAFINQVLMAEHIFRLEAHCSGINIVVLVLGSYYAPQLSAAVDTTKPVAPSGLAALGTLGPTVMGAVLFRN